MTTALYRRYRPETFADVIGQEHVTEPLMQALRTGRVNHAYLFSGPRGCGKTTSARILARCLNCEQGPTPTPCGVCESCVALARGGPGSVDVIEIDAASHGGVDDARDLRERASFGPASSRYKIYIIDEAHMVTPQGFNALLKIVEEPPEHVKFVFATTEPEKVIGTIRSRTHHYPFRLVPPKKLSDYMEKLLDAEGVPSEPGVLSFVTRAGGGSVRDSLSVLDQLIAGSGPEGLTYAGASSLLGFTDDELLDGIVEAFAAGDSAAVFRQIDRVVESGADPRRFVEDLLERLRDLIVVAAVAEGAGAVLRSVPEDQLERMRGQAASFGPGALSRAADVINAGLTEMTGATSPRLQLELMCARVLLPGIAGLDGYAARLDRMERRLEMGQLPAASVAGAVPHAPTMPPVGATAPSATPGVSGAARTGDEHSGVAADRAGEGSTAPRWQSPNAPQAQDGSASVASGSGAGSGTSNEDGANQGSAPQGNSNQGSSNQGGQAARDQQGRGQAAAADDARAQRSQGVSGGVSERQREQVQREFDQSQRAGQTQAGPQPAQQRGGMSTDDVRRAWPDVLDRIFRIKRVTWTLLSQNAQVMEFDGRRLVLGASSAGLAATMSRGQHLEVVRQALIEAIGVDVAVEARPMGEGPQGGGAPGSGGPGGPGSQSLSGSGAPSRQATPDAPRAGATPGQVDAGRAAPEGARQRSGWSDEPPAHEPPPDEEMEEFTSSSFTPRGGSTSDAPGSQDRGPGRRAVSAPASGGPGRQQDQPGPVSQQGQNAWGDPPSANPRGSGLDQPGQRPAESGRPGGWRDRTGWNGQGSGARQAPVDPARAGDPAAREVPREAATPSQDAGLASAAAQSSAWGSDTREEWSTQTTPAPSWVTDEASAAPSGAQAAEPTPDWMEDEPETDVEAVYDPLPPKSALGHEPHDGAGGEADRSGVTSGSDDGAGDGQAQAAGDPAAAGHLGAPTPQPTQGAVEDGRVMTPRQRAEKAAREAAQRDEDARIAGGGSRFDDASASVDDEDIENSDSVGLPVIKSVLGGTVIKEEGPDA